MLKCTIVRDDSNNVTKVNRADGQESVLFNRLRNIPALDANEALNAYMTAESTDTTGTPNVVFRDTVTGETTISYRKALDYKNFSIEANGVEVAKVTPSFDSRTPDGFMNQYIKDGIVDENKVTNNGQTYFKAEGGHNQKLVGINDAILKEDLLANISSEYKPVFTKNGVQVLHKSQTKNLIKNKGDKSYSEPKVERKTALDKTKAAYYNRFRNRKGTEVREPLTRKEITDRLKGLLNQMGVSQMAIDEYVTKFNVKDGVNQDVNALADLSRKIIAFKEGQMTLENLGEETAHFIVEGLGSEITSPLLEVVHQTQEWADHADHYRNIYGEKYKGDKLEQVVRKEILGKVLANGLLNNFTSENQVKRNLLERLRDHVIDFFNRLTSTSEINAQRRLDEFVEDINDLLVREELYDHLNMDAIDNSNDILYSAKHSGSKVNTLRNRLERTIGSTITALQQLKRGGEAFSAELDRIQALNKQITEEQVGLVQQSSIVEAVQVADSIANYLIKALDGSQTEGGEYVFNSYQETANQILQKNLNPLLNQLQNSARDNKWTDIVDAITQTRDKIDSIDAKVVDTVDSVLDAMVEDIAIRHNLSEDYKNYVKTWMETAHYDTSFLQAKFGMISNSRDPLLTLTSYLGERITNDTAAKFTEQARAFHQELNDTGVNLKELNALYDSEGYLVDAIDRGELQRELTKAMAVSHIAAKEGKSVKEVTEAEIEETLEKIKNRELDDLTYEQEERYSELYQKERDKIEEKPFMQSYYDQRRKDDEAANISEATKRRRGTYSQDRYNQRKDAIVTRGDKAYLDRSKMTEEAKEREESIKRDRAADKSIYTSDGTLKPSLENIVSSESNLRLAEDNVKKGVWQQYAEIDGQIFYLDSGVTQSTAVASRIALDLHRLDQGYLERAVADGKINQDGGFTKDFIDEYNRQPTNQAKISFIKNNVNIGFSQKFWDEISGDKSTMDVAREYGFHDRVETHEALVGKRRALISQFRNTFQPHEVMADKMLDSTKRAIEELDTEISNSSRDIAQLLRDLEVELPPSNLDAAITEVNKAFITEVKLSGKTYQEFLESKLTPTSKDRLNGFLNSLKIAETGRKGFNIPPAHLKIIEEGIRQGLTQAQIRDKYTTRLLPSYYTRFLPKEYTRITEEFLESNPDQFLKELSDNEYLTTRLDYSYLSDDGDANMLNPNYNPNHEGSVQPKKGQFVSQKYKQMFNPDSRGNPTTNIPLHKAREVLLNAKRAINDNNGVESDIYKVPQIYQKGVDRAFKFFGDIGRKRLEQEWKDFANYRVDDLEYGQASGDVNTIPIYYIKNVDNFNELSKEFFTSYSMMLQQSVLTQTRKEHMGKFMAIQDQILRRDSPKGKSAQSTKTYEMFNKYMDFMLYGVKESAEMKTTILGRPVDLTKLARFFLRSAVFRNLAGTPIVPFTSMFTQEIQYQIDQSVGEIVDRDASKMATKEFMRLAPGAIKDVGAIQTDSELNMLMEAMNVRKVEDRYQNSGYNTLFRNAPKFGMAMHQIMSFPVTERIAMSVLYNYRVIDGTVMNYNQFKRKRKTENVDLTSKQVRTEWRENANKSVRNYLDADLANRKTSEYYKMSDGKKVNYQQFLEQRRAEDGEITEGEIQREWTDLGKGLDQGVVWTDQAYKDIKPPAGETIEEHLERVMGTMSDAATYAVSRLDTQISQAQRTEAQRHFGLSFLMQHMGWLVIGTSTKFKTAQRNINSGEIEEGAYRTLSTYVGDAITALKTDGVKAFAEEWNKPGRLLAEEMGYVKSERRPGETKEDWESRDIKENQSLYNELVNLRRKNLRRAALDTTAALGVMTISALLMNLALDDEDEENYALQFGNYIALRTLHETLSNQTGIGQQWWNVLNSPIVGLNNFKAMARLPIDMFNGEELQSGFYKGYTRRDVAINRTIPFIKTFTDMSRMGDVRDQYYFYNSKNIKYSGIGTLYTGTVDAIKETYK